MNGVRAAAFALLLLCLGLPAAAQELRTAVLPDTVTVGEIFHVAVRLELPSDIRATFPDTLPVAGDVERAGPRVVERQPQPGGGVVLTARYPLTAWRPGTQTLPAIRVAVAAPGESPRTLAAEPGRVVIASVLPEDTAGIEPRPARDVVGPSWSIWPFVLGAVLLLLIAAGLLYWWRRRRRPESVEPVRTPTVSPRERALQALDRIRAGGALEARDYRRFYSDVTGAVRRFLVDTEPAWSTDLTTSELLERMRGSIDEAEQRALDRLLRSADRVKFARWRPERSEAERAWEAARAWVAAFGVPPEPDPDAHVGPERAP